MATSSTDDARVASDLHRRITMTSRELCTQTRRLNEWVSRPLSTHGRGGGGGDDKLKELRRLQLHIQHLLDSDRHHHVRIAGAPPYVKYQVRAPLTDTWRTYSGARPSLCRRFYPDASDSQLFSFGGRAAAGTPARARAMAPPPRAKTNARHCVCSGKEHGTLVHRQLQAFVEHFLNGYRSPLETLTGDQRIDPCVLRVMDACIKRAWLPIATELNVWDSELRIATQADLIVVDVARRRVVVVELTTGYESVAFDAVQPEHVGTAKARFAAPLDRVPNTPAQRKMLQAWLTAEIIRRHYGVTTVDFCVLRVCPRSHVNVVYSGAEWCAAPRLCAAAYDALRRDDAAAA